MRQSDFQPLETKDFLILAVIMAAILWGCWEAGTMLVRSRNASDANQNTQQSSSLSDRLHA
ncbi:hypothetical protein LJR231_004395 [Phyllobacterium sp. LjRoot231]|uniref:hypothetical protein n=1 Tax=Phyllobacterium sp. LjRoot231 TaxID=3342289 RepID=UPI003ECF4BA8